MIKWSPAAFKNVEYAIIGGKWYQKREGIW